ncbi:MAG: hypothetical protein ABI599_01480, partial [Flavobacteriales bacterium]
IWQGLWEFPLIETGRPANIGTLKKEMCKTLGGDPSQWRIKDASGPLKQLLSHQSIVATFWSWEPGGPWQPPVEWKPFSPKGAKKLAVHRLMERWLEAV